MPLTLAAALLLDALLGEPKWLWSRLPHPAVLMGRLVAMLDRHLNTGTQRRSKGVLALIILVAVAGGLGGLLSLGGPVIDLLVAAILLAQKSLTQHVMAVSDGLRVSVSDGRRAVAMIVSRDVDTMQTDQVARSAIESGAENLSDGVIAPAFWFLLAGVPGILIYKMVNTADSMIGYRTAKYEDFGWAAARADDLLNLIPARLTALLIALGHGQLPWRAIARDARLHKSPNAGWPEAAMARVLNVALAGPRSYGGQLRPLAWVNETGKKNIGVHEIESAVSAMWRCWGAMLVLVLLSAVV